MFSLMHAAKRIRVIGATQWCKKLLFAAAAAVFFGLPGLANAEITLDGTLSESGPIIPDGSKYEITPDHGEIRDSNLFHSFNAFNVNIGEIAVFTDPESRSFANILSRVTGGKLSNIDGTLRSEYQGANLFLINPSGIVFGPNVKIDVMGSFHASTADYIMLDGKARFAASTDPQKSTLSTASPVAFGFLSKNPSEIRMDNFLVNFFQSKPVVPPGESFSLVGGPIKVKDTIMAAPSGSINLVSVGGSIDITNTIMEATSGSINLVGVDGQDEVKISADQIKPIEGKMRVQINITESKLDTNNSVGQGSSTRISGGVINSTLSTIITSGQMLIDSSSHINLNETRLENTSINGDINISAEGQIKLENLTTITGNASKVSLFGKSIEIVSSQILNEIDPSAPGAPGSINLTAVDNITLDDEGRIFSRGTNEDAGDVTIEARTLELRKKAIIQGKTIGKGRGANVTITATEGVILESEGTQIIADSGSEGLATGSAGKIEVNASQLTILDGAEISSKTTGTGSAGKIKIIAGRFVVQDGGKVSATTSSSGTGGSIEIQATDVQLRDGGSISAKSTGTGKSGSIDISDADTVSLFDNSEITVTTDKADANADNINIKAKTLVHLRNNSAIETSAAENDPNGRGSGGNITIDPKIVVLDGASSIRANAQRGKGGNIRITITDGGALFQSPDSIIDASAGPAGIDGTVEIIRTDSDVIRGTLVLPETFLDAAKLLSEKCMARTAAGASSFVVSGRAGVPPGPDALLPDYASVLDDELVGEQGEEAAYTLPVTNLGSAQSRLSRLIIECNPS